MENKLLKVINEVIIDIKKFETAHLNEDGVLTFDKYLNRESKLNYLLRF
jgi:hypothetical protein